MNSEIWNSSNFKAWHLFKKILIDKFELTVEEAQKMTQEYLDALYYAKSQGLFPPPNPRNLINKAEEEQSKDEFNSVTLQ